MELSGDRKGTTQASYPSKMHSDGGTNAGITYGLGFGYSF